MVLCAMANIIITTPTLIDTDFCCKTLAALPVIEALGKNSVCTAEQFIIKPVPMIAFKFI